MDILCKPALTILLVAIAGTLYHLLVADYHGMIWWVAVGVLGTSVFQGMCAGGLEPATWVLMAIPVLIVCFFLAIALFASSMRIQNVKKVACNRCGKTPVRKPCCNKPKEERCGCQSL